MVETKIWDDLIQDFNVHGDEIDPGVADNILIAWPPIVKFLGEHVPKSGRVLEYGCGTGGLVKKLASLGYSVVGIDPAPKMIEVAKSHMVDIPFITGDESSIDKGEKFNAITAIMVFQFVENIEETFRKLTLHLNQGGVFVFAIFNPEFVVKCTEKNILFRLFATRDCRGKGTMDFGEGRTTDVYIREANEYDNVMKQFGFVQLLEAYPTFTQEFIEKYPTYEPVEIPEFLILAYKKV